MGQGIKACGGEKSKHQNKRPDTVGSATKETGPYESHDKKSGAHSDTMKIERDIFDFHGILTAYDKT